jgi:hypothetical protein
VHAVAEVHETPDRLVGEKALRSEVGWIVQVLPSQRSANVAPLLDPTAMHAAADVHDTPFRLPPPLAVGVVCKVQVLPSQRSANVAPLLDPTAMQAAADVHEIPFRLLFVAPRRFGVVCKVQALPSQLSASVTWLPAVSS